MGWTCNLDGKFIKGIHNFGGETFLKEAIWTTGDRRTQLRILVKEAVRWLKLIQDSVQWWVVLNPWVLPPENNTLYLSQLQKEFRYNELIIH